MKPKSSQQRSFYALQKHKTFKKYSFKISGKYLTKIWYICNQDLEILEKDYVIPPKITSIAI